MVDEEIESLKRKIVAHEQYVKRKDFDDTLLGKSYFLFILGILFYFLI